MNHVHQTGDECNVELEFNQLYGGGQGIYGQTTHEGVNTNVKYLITFMHDGHVEEIQFITDNSADHTVVFPELTDLDSNKTYSWLDYTGKAVTKGSEKVPAGNIRDVFYYLNESNVYYARFVDKDGLLIEAIQFDPKKGEFLNGKTAPTVPEMPGYYGQWETYTLKGAQNDLIINPVYTVDENATVLTDSDALFALLAQGKSVAMSQDLSGGFGSGNKNNFCSIPANITSRVDLNSFILSYNGDSNANKDWTLFTLGANSKLTIGAGMAGHGTLTFNLNSLNSNAKPCLFNLANGATLVLERGVVIEFNYPTNNNNTITLLAGVSNFTGVNTEAYPGLVIEQSAGVIRVTVTARTVLVGDTTTTTK
jgi:hypothetical protein